MTVRERGGRGRKRGRSWLLAGLCTGVALWVGLGFLTGDDVHAGAEDLAAEPPPALTPHALRAAPGGRQRQRTHEPRTPAEDTSSPVPAKPAEIARLVDDLAHDLVPNNADRAMARLQEIGKPAMAELERALLARDLQQRQLAAHLLRYFVTEPSDALLRVTVTGLRQDLMAWDPAGGNFFLVHRENAPQAATYLLDRTRRALPNLLEGLFSIDTQQRFLCSFLLARSGVTDQLWRTCQILVGHLEDNNIPGDAMMAAHALYRLGRPALPYVRGAQRWADAQAQQLLERIELDIESPPRTHADRVARRKNISRLGIDPVNYSVDSLAFVSWGTRSLAGSNRVAPR